MREVAALRVAFEQVDRITEGAGNVDMLAIRADGGPVGRFHAGDACQALARLGQVRGGGGHAGAGQVEGYAGLGGVVGVEGQRAGADAVILRHAAQRNIHRGAAIGDINGEGACQVELAGIRPAQHRVAEGELAVAALGNRERGRHDIPNQAGAKINRAGRDRRSAEAGLGNRYARTGQVVADAGMVGVIGIEGQAGAAQALGGPGWRAAQLDIAGRVIVTDIEGEGGNNAKLGGIRPAQGGIREREGDIAGFIHREGGGDGIAEQRAAQVDRAGLHRGGAVTALVWAVFQGAHIAVPLAAALAALILRIYRRVGANGGVAAAQRRAAILQRAAE